MDKIRIECLWYRSKRDFNKFIKTIDGTPYTAIDYLLIKNKLIKADPYHAEPHDHIIGFNIINMITAAFNLEKNPTTKLIVYSFKNLNRETVINFRSLVETQTGREYTLALNVLNMETIPSIDILNQFDCVKFVDNK